MQFDPLMYEPQTKCVVIKEKDCFCLIREGGNVGQADLIGGVWRLLSLLDETQIDASARDRMGTFRVPDLPDARRIHARTPIAEDMAKLIFLNFVHSSPGFSEAKLDRWPNHKKWVLLLTSDMDHIHIGFWKEILYNFTKFIMRGNSLYGSLFFNGLRYLGRFESNPLWLYLGGRNGLKRMQSPCAFIWLYSLAESHLTFMMYAPVLTINPLTGIS